MNIYAALLTAAYLINLIVAVSIVFSKQKDVKSTTGWILMFMFFPIIGYIFYLFLGSRSKFKILSRKYSIKKLQKGFNRVLKSNIKNIENREITLKNNFCDMIELNAKNAGSVYSNDNCVEFYASAQEKYTKMFAEIEAAKESINVEYFIIKTKDEIGKKFISLLAKKARQGVEVRLIYDRLGTSKMRRKDFKPLTDAGGMAYR